MGVSKNGGTPKSSILIYGFPVKTIHFGVPLFLETSIYWPGLLPVVFTGRRIRRHLELCIGWQVPDGMDGRWVASMGANLGEGFIPIACIGLVYLPT